MNSNHKLYIKGVISIDSIDYKEPIIMLYTDRFIKNKIVSPKILKKYTDGLIKNIITDVKQHTSEDRMKIDIELLMGVKSSKFPQNIKLDFTVNSTKKLRQVLESYIKEHILKPLHNELI